MIKLILTLLLGAGLNGMVHAGEPRLPDEIIIKYRSANRVADHGKVLRRNGKHLDVVRLAEIGPGEAEQTKAQRLLQRIRQIRQDPEVLFAEPNFQGHFEQSLPAIPNDTAYPSQWWLAAVGDREMWALGRGTGVIVAVIDTGVDLTHPDLMSNLLPNGYNFGDGNASPQDVLGHGTKVAGIIAARQNNAIGVSGLAPEAMILPIKINVAGLNTFSSDQLANGLAYAVAQGARIINLSLTVDQHTQTVQDAIQAALDKGIVVVAAAGNNGGAVEFPGTMPGVLAIAATDQSRRLSSTSNFGPEILVAAPGIDILSTALGGNFAASNPGGTSFAAPVVSATIADMLSINTALPLAVISTQLRNTASAIAEGRYAFGIVDAGATGNSLVPHLQLSKQQFSAVDSVAINYSLPPTTTPLDIYIAVDTPLGGYSLRPGGHWLPVSRYGYQPAVAAYRSESGVSGALYGNPALFPPLDLAGLPAGSYTWEIVLVSPSAGRLVGPVMTAPMQLH